MSFGAEFFAARQRPFELNYIGFSSNDSDVAASGNWTFSNLSLGALTGQPGAKILLHIELNYDNSGGNNWAASEFSLTLGGVSGTPFVERDVGISLGGAGDREITMWFEFDARQFSSTEDLVITAGSYVGYFSAVHVFAGLNFAVVDTLRIRDTSFSAPDGASGSHTNRETDLIVIGGAIQDDEALTTYSGFTLDHQDAVQVGAGGGRSARAFAGRNLSPNENQTISVTPTASSTFSAVSVAIRRN